MTPLSPHARSILLCLLASPESVVTTSALAGQLHVSARTVQRALPEVSDWLKQYDIILESKTGSGLHMTADSAQCQAALAALSRPNQMEISREERRKSILNELLLASQPIKAGWFSKHFGISGGTLSDDLHAIEAWAKPYGLVLQRKAGSGISLHGSEAAYRSAIAAMIDSRTLLQLLRGSEPPDCPPSVIRSAEQTAQLEQIIANAQEHLGICLTDSGYAALFVHLSLAITRLQQGQAISIPSEQLSRLRMLPEYAAAEEITDALQTAFSIRIPADETGFITMHLIGSSVRTKTGHNLTDINSLELYRLAREMSHIVEQKLQVSFDGSELLLDGLCTHLEPVIHRLRLGIPIENSECAEIKQNYPELYAAAQDACALLKREFHIAEIPDTEIALLTAHFGAALEELRTKEKTITAVVTCPTGVGTSRLLAASLTQAFPQLELRGTRSAFHLDPEALKNEGIDIIISTVDLDIKYRFIRVSPVLTERDKMVLNTVIPTILQQKKFATHPIRAPFGRAQVDEIGRASTELSELLDHIVISPVHLVHARTELIEAAAKLFASDDISSDIIRQVFENREALGDTYIKPFRALLLHGRTECVSHCRFGYVRLQPPLYENGKIIQGAIVMLIPSEQDTTCQKLMSRISALLLDHHELLQDMRSGNLTGLRDTLTSLLLPYYKKNIKELLGE